jgi:hypothetical protein
MLDDVHCLTLRYDDFGYGRTTGEILDSGHAWTLGYRHDSGEGGSRSRSRAC